MSSFENLRIVDNFYQTSLFFPMPTVLISTLCEDGTTNLGPYSLIQPYYRREKMKEYSVLMALADMIPVAMFLVGSVMLQRDLYNKMSKGAFALYATGICDFEVLSKMFFPTASIGFLLAGIGMLGMICHRQSEKTLAVAPPLFTGTFLCMFSMGYLSSRDFTQAYMNWICECINFVGQGLYLFCAIRLKKAGLRELQLHN